MITINIGAILGTVVGAIIIGWMSWVSKLLIRVDKRMSSHLAYHAGVDQSERETEL